MPNRSTFALIDRAGRTCEAYELISSVDTSNLSERSTAKGLSTYRLVDGLRLNKIDDATFVLVATGEEFKRSSA